MGFKLLSPSYTNAKTAKNDGFGYHSAILHLAPSDLSGYNVCPFASEGCKKACLNTAGRGAFSNVQAARIRKTKLLFENSHKFYNLLFHDLDLLERQAQKLRLKPVCRLNGTSDKNWLYVISLYPNIVFYDYTKNINLIKQLKLQQSKGQCLNYSLTFSRSESNWAQCLEAISLGFNVAIVFDKTLPELVRVSTTGFLKVIDGLKHDLRFLDPKGSIVGLLAKGKAKVDATGFVWR